MKLIFGNKRRDYVTEFSAIKRNSYVTHPHGRTTLRLTQEKADRWAAEAQVIDHLPGMHKAQGSILSTT